MLEKINQIFGDIKDAIQEKGVDIGDCESPETYADRIKMIKIASDSDCEGECCDGATGYVYYLFPVFKASATAPNTPSESANAIVLADNDNYISRLTYPNGWESVNSVLTTGANNIRNSVTPKPMWMSYCIFAIKQGTVTMFRTWTPPMCLGYPYTNPTTNLPYDNPNGGISGNNKYNASKTFVVFTEMASSNVVPSRPTGGFWNIDTNQLTGKVISTTSAGNIIWHTNYYHVSGTYTYVSIGTFDYNGNLIGTWSDPFCITSADGKNGSNGKDGRDGRDGADGVNIEFIYKRCTNLSAFRELTAPESEIYITNHVPTGWTAQPTGIDCTDFKVEACCTRKLTSNGVWGEWQGPVIWAICGGSGSGSGDGSGDGSNGRSVVNVEYWFKLSNSDSITSPALEVTDPTTEGWSKVASNPTESLRYLWCFVQINYSYELSTGYTYSRTSAYIVRYFNSDISSNFQELEERLNELEQEINERLDQFQDDFVNKSEDLDELRTQLENDIKTTLDETYLRLRDVEGTDVETILDKEKGVWGVLTSYKNDSNATEAQKSFADLMLDAKNATTKLNNGAALVDSITSAGLTIDGLGAAINAKATKQEITDEVTAQVNQAQWAVASGAITSSVSKGQICWKDKDGVLRPYMWHYSSEFTRDPWNASQNDLYTPGTGETLGDYETYMIGEDTSRGVPSDGPLEKIVMVDEFSNIAQTADSIEAAVNKTTFVWKKGTEIKKYDDPTLEALFNDRPGKYQDYSYDSYLENQGWEKTEIGKELSSLTVTANEIQSQVGDAVKVWIRWDSSNEVYETVPYEWDSSKGIRKDYEDEYTNAGWELKTFAQSVSTIEQTKDSITLAVDNSKLYWHKDGENDVPYDNFWTNYQNSKGVYNGTTYDSYNEYVEAQGWELKNIRTEYSEIRQTANSITSVVSTVKEHTSAIEQLSDKITLATEGDSKYWNIKDSITYRNKTLYGPYPYRQWWDDYVDDIGGNDEPTTEGYETWVPGTVGEENPDYVELKTDGYSLGAFSLENDQILMGLSGHNGEYYGAITLQKESGTNNAKIVLDANNTQVNGDLLVGAINDATTKISGNTIATGTITADKIAANSITADKIAAGAINTNKVLTAGNGMNVLIKNGKVAFYYGAVDENNPDQNKRIEIGVEGESNNDLVLKFFDADGTELYNLGPSGFTDMNGQFIYEFDHNLD